MNTTTRQFVFGAIFFAIGIYRLINSEWIDFGLYSAAGAAFVANGLTMVAALKDYKKGLAILTWALIFIAGIFFIQVAGRLI